MGTRMTRIARIFADFAERGVDRDFADFFAVNLLDVDSMIKK